tara:strand:- start:1416 stop:1907 length:492 start_codon:yes stop_codon:yes gene_type:complete
VTLLQIRAEPLTEQAFAPFGDVLAISGPVDKVINAGMCDRYHDRARLDFGDRGRAGISIFKAQARSLPYTCDLLERHPDGSQAFIPMSQAPWMVIVAPDAGGTPGAPRAFLPAPGQGVNFLRGIWHGVLTPLAEPGLFAVIDRIGDTTNLQEHFLDRPFTVTS